MEDIEIFSQWLDLFAKTFGINLSKNALAAIIFTGSVILTYIAIPAGKRAIRHLKLQRGARRFNPYIHHSEMNESIKFYVSTYFQNIPPSHEQEPSNSHAFSARQKLMSFFFEVFKDSKNHSDKYYIILADSGMGKTTFLINLFLNYSGRIFKQYEIYIFPLGQPDIEHDIVQISDEVKCRSIILLDALDEDPKASEDYVKRINELVSLTVKFRYVLISCRTQFFPSEDAEPYEINIRKYGGQGDYHVFKKIYLSPFSNRDIRKYLLQKFKIFQISKIVKSYFIVKRSRDIMVRPMLLSYIESLIDFKINFSSSLDIYSALIESWINREANRKPAQIRQAFKNNLNVFSRKVAIEIYKNYKVGQKFLIDNQSIGTFATKHDIKLSNLDIKTRSLLNRDAIGNYKFAHKSILEYYIAYEAFHSFEFLKNLELSGFTLVKRFYSELCAKGILTYESENLLRLRSVETFRIRKAKDFPIKLLAGLSKLKKLDLSEAGLTTEQLHYIKMCDSLHELNVQGNGITDIDIIGDLLKLRHLNASFNKVQSANVIKRFNSLESLHLNDNELKGLFIVPFNLIVLDISNNPVSSLNVAPRNNLVRLNISNTSIDSVEHIHRSIIEQPYTNSIWGGLRLYGDDIVPFSQMDESIPEMLKVFKQDYCYQFNNRQFLLFDCLIIDSEKVRYYEFQPEITSQCVDLDSSKLKAVRTLLKSLQPSLALAKDGTFDLLEFNYLLHIGDDELIFKIKNGITLNVNGRNVREVRVYQSNQLTMELLLTKNIGVIGQR